MIIELSLANINFIIHSNLSFGLGDKMKRFVGKNDNDNVVNIYFSFNKKEYVDCSAKNIFTKYYSKNDEKFYLVKNGIQHYVSICKYDDKCNLFVCSISYLNMEQVLSLENLLQLIPLNLIFQYHDVLVFHASQVSLNASEGLLFVGPSGIGKTTQSKLWEKFATAKIVCNDRTLIRKINGKWMTYGFFSDGTEPVCSNEVNYLKGIIYLTQQKENVVERLSVIESVKYLRQQIISSDNVKIFGESTIEQLLNVLNDVPVYHLGCTPDKRAVNLLKIKLKEEGVICFEA